MLARALWRFEAASAACARRRKALRARPRSGIGAANFRREVRFADAPSPSFSLPFFVRPGSATTRPAAHFDARGAARRCVRTSMQAADRCASMRRNRRPRGLVRTVSAAAARAGSARESHVSKKFLLDESMHCKCADAVFAHAAAAPSSQSRTVYRCAASAARRASSHRARAMAARAAGAPAALEGLCAACQNLAARRLRAAPAAEKNRRALGLRGAGKIRRAGRARCALTCARAHLARAKIALWKSASVRYLALLAKKIKQNFV